MGHPDAARSHRAAFGGVGSPALAKTQGTGISHPDTEPCRERLDDDTEDERAAQCNGKMRALMLN